jgi:hypothetical protein
MFSILISIQVDRVEQLDRDGRAASLLQIRRGEYYQKTVCGHSAAQHASATP